MAVASVRVMNGGEVERWPTELPLQAICILVSLGIYALLVLSVIGLLYAVAIAAFFMTVQAMLVAHVRGSAVRLGPDQFPDLHRRVQEIAARIGLEQVPDAYLMQAGGALNAFATRLLGLNVIVLYSELLEACGDNEAARDMIIGHELGHIRAGHLRLRWLVGPGMAVPFLGTALSRAREYTCDRWGVVGAGDRDGALLGLTILAAGGKRAAAVNRKALASQRADLATGWLAIGEWLGTHPPLARRLAAIDPMLVAGTREPVGGKVRGILIVTVFLLGIVLAGVLVATLLPRIEEVRREAAAEQRIQSSVPGQPGG